jgi:hypothetical protein
MKVSNLLIAEAEFARIALKSGTEQIANRFVPRRQISCHRD